jgi:hypothetical protein
MRGVPRLLALVLLGVGVVAAIAGAIWIFVARQSVTPEGWETMSTMRRGIALFVYSKFGGPAGVALIVGAIGGAALLFLALRRKHWALALIAAAAVGAIVAMWGARYMVKRMEDPRYAAESRYVRAATSVAIAGTVYFAALGACALAGFLLVRREPAGVSPPSPAPSPASPPDPAA